MVYMAVRILSNVTSMAHWQYVLDQNSKGELSNDQCDLNFFNRIIEPYYEIAIYSTISIGVLLDTFCWKYRKLAGVLFIYECINLLLSAFICTEVGVHSSFVTFASLLLLLITLGCHAGICIFLALVSYFIIELVLNPNASDKEAPSYLIYHMVIYFFGLLVSTMLSFLVIKWIFRLLRKLEMSEQTPRNLIDQMSEGCLVYSF